MLVYFSCENFRSIKTPIELNLRAAPRLRRHKDHFRMPTDDKSLKVLKSAVMYGANASGKSNIIKAIDAVKKMVTNPPLPNQPTAHEPFALTDNIQAESSFYLEFTLSSMLFSYSVTFNQSRIIEEKLCTLTKTTEAVIYSRKYLEKENYAIHTDIRQSDEMISAEAQQEFRFLIKFTSKNKLFLSEFQDRDILEKLAEPFHFLSIVFGFFEFGLMVIYPSTRYAGLYRLLEDSDKSNTNLNDLIQKFDTGICKLQATLQDTANFPDELIDLLKQALTRKNSATTRYKGKEYTATLNDKNELVIIAVATIHNLPSGKSVEFDLDAESDGTIRLLDLLPSIQIPGDQNFSITFIIDEFDRSLHPNLAKAFLQLFLNSDYAKGDDQLIVTTHQAELLDNELLRRDEIWFVQKEWDQSSKLYSLNDYSTRFDKDIHKAYLEGRFGAVPMIMEDFEK